MVLTPTGVGWGQINRFTTAARFQNFRKSIFTVKTSFCGDINQIQTTSLWLLATTYSKRVVLLSKGRIYQQQKIPDNSVSL